MIIPFPNGAFRYEGKHFTFPSEYEIVCPRSFSCDAFIEKMAGLGHSLSSGAPFVIRHQDASEMSDGAYILYITERGVDVFSNGQAGFQYGLASLLMTIVSKKGRVRPMIVEDAPKYEYRGVMVDCCRHFFSAEEIKKIIDQCALLKINQFHWHLSDDQGFRIESKVYPKLNSVGSFRRLSSIDPLVKDGKMKIGDTYGGYYTQEEMKDVVEYAKRRSVNIVPELEMPGHASAILAAYPELSCSGEQLKVRDQFGIFKRVFCAGKESTYEFIEKLLDEIMSLFPGKYIHIGGDECPTMEWEACPHCAALGDISSIQPKFMNRIIRHLEKRGKTAICWNESFKTHEIEKSAIGQYWNEMGSGKSLANIEAKAGRKFILSNMNAFYFDYPSADLPLRATLGYTPNMKGEKIPATSIFGVEACLWSEWIADEKTLEEHLSPRLLAYSESAWNHKKASAKFYKDMQRYLTFESLNILHGVSFEEAEPKREDSLKQVVINMVSLSARYHMDEEEKDPDNVTFIATKNENEDPMDALTAFFEEKLRFGYTKQDIQKIIAIIQGGAK